MDSGARFCMSCGRSIAFDVNVCPYCGRDFRVVSQARAGKELSPGIRALLYVVSILVWLAGVIIGIVLMARDDLESKHVGKICLILGLVSIVVTAGLSATLYVMVMGFGDDANREVTPTASLTKYYIGDDVKFAFLPPNDGMHWSDLSISLSDGDTSLSVSWNPVSSDLTGEVGETEEYAAKSLESVSVALTITDLAGDGEVGMGDSLLLSPDPGFSMTTTYTLTVMWEPTGGTVCTATFTG